MTGLLVVIIGPSGVGKDTILAALTQRLPNAHKLRRYITRPAELGGEDYISITQDAFDTMKREGEFILDWQAHGLSYGVHRDMRTSLDLGKTLLLNGSRGALSQVFEGFPEAQVYSITAQAEELRKRLIARGRESAQDIERRLERAAAYAVPDHANVTAIDNSGDVDTAVAQIYSHLSNFASQKAFLS